MSTAVATPTPTPLPVVSMDHDVSPKTYSHLAPSSSPLRATNGSSTMTVNAPLTRSPPGSADERTSPSARTKAPPKIIVKKEPAASPELATTSRHRPRKLDLSKGSTTTTTNPPMAARTSANPLTARESTTGLGMHDVGLACLSPGFVTQDPTMREQLQRSISVRDQQRHIIESRLQRSARPGETDTSRPAEVVVAAAAAAAKTPSSRRKAPPGLSIVAPSHEQFAHERVIQSAPLHASFPGRHHPDPWTRHVANQPSNLATTAHIHHVHHLPTATSSSSSSSTGHLGHRLPPITDVLGVHRDGGRGGPAPGYFPPGAHAPSTHSASRPTFPSPGHPPSQSAPAPPSSAGRPREYRSAEEAVASMSGGREDLLPRIIHYGGHQPPTPPSPLPLTTNPMNLAPTTAVIIPGTSATTGPAPPPPPPPPPPHKLTHSYSTNDVGRHGLGRRRNRMEYERDMGSPPLGNGPDPARRLPFGDGRDSPDGQRRKKDEFLMLCGRAWDLFHS